MKMLRLDVEALEVTSFQTASVTADPQPVARTGATGYCNTCWGACDWTA